MNTPSLADFRRVVVKVGSSLLVDAKAGRLKDAWLASLTADLAEFHRQGRDVLVVSSGAIALGRAVLKLAGDGLTVPLVGFRVAMNPQAPPELLDAPREDLLALVRIAERLAGPTRVTESAEG